MSERLTRREWEAKVRAEDCAKGGHSPAIRIASISDPIGFHCCECGGVRWTAETGDRLAQAWDEGKHSEHTPECRLGDGDCICRNPYRREGGDGDE